MYQYKAILKASGELVSEGHNITEVEHGIIAFKRAQKRNEHTKGNEQIQIFHAQRDHVSGKAKDVLVKVV